MRTVFRCVTTPTRAKMAGRWCCTFTVADMLSAGWIATMISALRSVQNAGLTWCQLTTGCPEHPHPAAFDDAMTACAWARKRFDEPLILVGDSAGGNLAAAVAHAVRGQAEILGQVLSYPGLGGDPDNGSYRVMADAPMLTLADVLGYSGLRSGGVRHDGDASFAPLWDSDFSAAQPTVAISAECDPLCDDARDYALAINAAGGVAVWINDKGLVHGHLRARHTVTRARASFDRVLRAIRLIGSGDAVTRAKIKG